MAGGRAWGEVELVSVHGKQIIWIMCNILGCFLAFPFFQPCYVRPGDVGVVHVVQVAGVVPGGHPAAGVPGGQAGSGC